MQHSSHHKFATTNLMNNVMQQLQSDLNQVQRDNVDLEPTKYTNHPDNFLPVKTEALTLVLQKLRTLLSKTGSK